MIVFAITIQMTIQDFLARNLSKVLNGQHRWVIFHWPRLVPHHWLSCFKILHYHQLLLCRANAAWDMQWRHREKRNDHEHHENPSFFHLAKFWMFFFFVCVCVLFLRKYLLQILCCFLRYYLFIEENVQKAVHRCSSDQVFLNISQCSPVH